MGVGFRMGCTVSYLASGKRSHIFVLEQQGRKYALKIERDDTTAVDRLLNEYTALVLLNQFCIGPRLREFGYSYLLYEFVEGEFILDYLAHSSAPWPVLKQVFSQCRQMDILGINKLEMHHPVKHVIVKGRTVTLIDFERCYFTPRPKNVSQFSQFLCSERVRSLLSGKLKFRSDAVRKACRVYQHAQTDENYKLILACFITS